LRQARRLSYVAIRRQRTAIHRQQSRDKE